MSKIVKELHNFYLPVSEETCNYLRRLSFEVEGRLEIINRLFTIHANDTDASVLTSVPFKTYHKEFEEINAEYSLAKESLTNELMKLVNEKYQTENPVDFDWKIENFDDNRALITAKIYGE